MRLLVQRVSKAHVEVGQKVVGSIQAGILVLFGVRKGDTLEEVRWLANKVLNFRIFSDEDEKMNRSLLDISGSLLVVSQFTLYADCSEGRRPSFTNAASPDLARKLYDAFITEVKKSQIVVETAIFGEKMEVHLINDGPVTFILEK